MTDRDMLIKLVDAARMMQDGSSEKRYVRNVTDHFLRVLDEADEHLSGADSAEQSESTRLAEI